MMQQSALILLTIITFTCCRVTLACHGKLIASGITAEEKSIIMQEHNRLRQLVATGRYPGQPGAENMREIVWDDELAARAQQWADNCQFRHDPHRTINRFTMGQNLAIIWSTAPLEADDGDFPSRIQNWFNEVQKYSFGDAWSPKTGHYSQLVWGETSLVGCGFSEYKDASKYNKLYVCNYGPGGNVVGYNPYEVGKPSCSTYGMKPSSRYQGLCAAPGSSPAISNSVYETYDYSYNSALTSNNKPTNNINKSPQATTNNDYNKPSAYPPQPASAAAASATSSSGGSSFGTATRGSSFAYTTERNQQAQWQSGKYKPKLEAYRPSAAEFEKSVHKHTILRTYIDQNRNQQKEQEQQQQAVISDTPSTQKPQRGWSLLTWRG
ncbi:uncharacterized protein Dwil_GK22774 [Drosophila willistoni]|uniref:SCP domain-containing protein n=1 Tax=Drosophila willistoni TaxID=7260 RepID=B4NG58_DROWI|nr:cysteine-rich venom protein pseudechetoxin-like [Drosophila willistoni]EDW83275.1 uncharacterized protein Dwil_GK22774 [Drosophila willistoni]